MHLCSTDTVTLERTQSHIGSETNEHSARDACPRVAARCPCFPVLRSAIVCEAETFGGSEQQIPRDRLRRIRCQIVVIQTVVAASPQALAALSRVRCRDHESPTDKSDIPLTSAPPARRRSPARPPADVPRCLFSIRSNRYAVSIPHAQSSKFGSRLGMTSSAQSGHTPVSLPTSLAGWSCRG